MDKINLTRKDLYDLVWSKSVVAISKEYNISDAELRKLCQQMNISLPKNGHWIKLRFNKEVQIEPLPVDETCPQQVEMELRKEGEEIETSPLKRLMKEMNFKVPIELNAPDLLIIAARKRLKGDEAWAFMNYKGVVECRTGELAIRVSPGNVTRALIFMDTFIKALRKRKHDIQIRNDDTFAIVQGQDIKISFSEKMKRVKMTDNKWERTELHPIGILCFRVEGYHGKEWKDSKDGMVKVESYLSEIIAWLEIESERKAGERAFYDQQNDHLELKREKEQLIIVQQENDQDAFEAMLERSERWQKAINLRRYIDEIETAVWPIRAGFSGRGRR